MKAYLRQTRISPKKINLIAELARNKKAVEAIDVLKFTPKKAARILEKLIASAVANAENNFSQKAAGLIVQEIVVTEGPTYKRSVPVSRGRAHPILKRTSHVTVKLSAVTAAKEVAVKEDSGKEEAVQKAEKPVKKVSSKPKTTTKSSK